MVECYPDREIRNFKIRLEHDQSHRHSCTLHSGLHWAKVIMPNGIPARRAPVASADDPRTRHCNCEARQRSSQRRRQHTCQQCPFRASTCSRSVGSHSRYWKEQSVGAYRQCASYQIPVVTSYQLQHCCRVAAVADDALQPHRPRVKTKSGSTIPETCTAAQLDRTPSGSSASFTCAGARCLLPPSIHIPRCKSGKIPCPLKFQVLLRAPL